MKDAVNFQFRRRRMEMDLIQINIALYQSAATSILIAASSQRTAADSLLATRDSLRANQDSWPAAGGTALGQPFVAT